jgi:hypothetical protein
MQGNYPIFAEYHYYIKKWFQCLLTLPRITALGLTIPVTYSTPRRAFATGGSELEAGDAGGGTQYAPPNQGNNWLPILAFRSTNFTQIVGKTTPYEHVLSKPIQDNNDTITSWQKYKAPLVYELSYTAVLYAGLMQDMDILTFKIVTEFKPNANLWIGPPGSVGDRTLGVYANMLLESVVDATEYEPGDIGERVVRKDFSWKITEAYVPTTDAIIDSDIVNEIYFDYPEEDPSL